ncbi:tyrosinase family protein, partial [Bacillus sp. TSA_111.2]
MSHRRDLNNDLSAQERTSLVNLILNFLNDAIVAEHTTIVHNDIHIFTGHRAYIEKLEAFLNNNGGAQFVPLPMWNPANPIPTEFNVVKSRDNGAPRSPLVNLNPNLPLPLRFTYPALCLFSNGDELGNAVAPWHNSVHTTVGGSMADFPNASAAPIFWCWHAFVDHVYWNWQHECGRPRVPGIMWHNSDTNETQIWFMDDHKIISRETVLREKDSPIFVGLPWSIVGTSDMNGNGKSDIVWHNSDTNETQIWFMNDHKIISRATVLGENGSPFFVGAPWSIVGTSDMNGNGKSDIVWHNSDTNETQIWFMDGYRIISRETVLGENGSPFFVGAPWSIVGTSDMNGNGKSDVVWHNSDTNETQIWFMDDHKIISRETVLGENGSPFFV